MYLIKEDVNLFYEVCGEGAALLLIHGVIVDAGLYEQTAEYLSRHYKVITYDRRGNSRSICKAKPEFYLEKQIEDIIDLLNILEIDKVSIVGTSAGAVIGQYFFKNIRAASNI